MHCPQNPLRLRHLPGHERQVFRPGAWYCNSRGQSAAPPPGVARKVRNDPEGVALKPESSARLSALDLRDVSPIRGRRPAAPDLAPGYWSVCPSGKRIGRGVKGRFVCPSGNRPLWRGCVAGKHGAVWGVALTVALLAGCSWAPAVPPDPQLRALAARYVCSAVGYTHNPGVRAEAIEAAESLPADQRAIIRSGLKDEHPSVRFAACLATGRLKDAAARSEVQKLLGDADPNVRVGVYFALERLGDRGYRQHWAQCLRRHPDATLRRNAALALGRLGDKSALPLLQEASTLDDDEGVRVQALEGLAALGDKNAINHLTHDAFGGIGYKQPFALLALGRAPGDQVVPTLRSRLTASPYIESRLAAARSLGMHGHAAGLALAMEFLNWTESSGPAMGPITPSASPAKGPTAPQPMPLMDDSPENQRMRIRTMAAMALGDIGDPRALPWLKQRMEEPDDPRVQLAAARAILMILK